MADFVRLVRELHSLQELRGVRLTWSSDREEVLMTPARRWVTRSRLQKVELSDCAPHHRSSAMLWVDSPGICSAVGGLVRLVDGQLAEAAIVESEHNVFVTKSTFSEYLIFAPIIWILIISNFAKHIVVWSRATEGSLKLSFEGPSSVSLPDGTSVSAASLAEYARLLVRIIEVDFDSGDCPGSWIIAVDWAAFAGTVASFPQLECIVVLVMKGSEQEAAYMEHAHQPLKSLSHDPCITLDVREIERVRSRCPRQIGRANV